MTSCKQIIAVDGCHRDAPEDAFWGGYSDTVQPCIRGISEYQHLNNPIWEVLNDIQTITIDEELAEELITRAEPGLPDNCAGSTWRRYEHLGNNCKAYSMHAQPIKELKMHYLAIGKQDYTNTLSDILEKYFINSGEMADNKQRFIFWY